MIRINIQVEQWRIERLIPRIANPRTHSPQQITQIAASIREWGWTNPILVGANNDVVGAISRLNWPHISSLTINALP
jgi:ParB-like chromosome segregation protein Spo0J